MRVKVAGRWRAGKAHVMPQDDPIARQRNLDALNASIVRLAGTELLTVRIDFDREAKAGARKSRAKRA